MSDDEVLKFEITDHDLETEFKPHRRKAKKEQEIYGVWAKDSDEEGNEDNVRRRERKPRNLSSGIGFVAGGVQQAGKKGKDVTEKEAPSMVPRRELDSSDEEVKAPEETETAGLRRQGLGMKSASLGSNVGNWEKHTKGIGAKLLLQMGYQPGKGLGKALQGISAPVEATLRKGRGAIGAYGPEKAAQKAKREEAKKALKDKEDEPERLNNWKKSHKGRYFYRDAVDVIQEGKPTTIHTESSSTLSQVPVIDMTGRERRVLSGYHALRGRCAPRYEHEPRRALKHFSAPELTHNIQLMVECCEQDIILNHRQRQTAEDEVVALERETELLQNKLLEEDKQIAGMAGIMDKLDELEHLEEEEDARHIFLHLKEKYSTEYSAYELSSAAAFTLDARMSTVLSSWEPLSDPTLPVDAFVRWRPLCAPTAFQTLLWKHYIGNMAKAAESWNPRAPQPMLSAVTAWRDAVPDWMVRHAGAACVAPRITAAARDWRPTHDTQPVHAWVLPWHQLAGEALTQTVYPILRERLAEALAAWHPCDASAKPLLQPWREAWGGALTLLLHQHIVPKLEACLAQAPVDVLTGNVEAWTWCVEWLEMVGAATLASVAARALLPRWLAALAAWLNSGPQHATLLTAYSSWKSMFPEEILKEPAVKDVFRKALDMMNRSADLGIAVAPPPPSFRMDPTQASSLAAVMASSNQQKSFSELLESRCQELGISLLPLVGRTREGRPLFRIGTTMQCYVVKNVVMYSSDHGRTFEPISLDPLLQLAAST